MNPYYDEGGVTIYHGDVREVLPTLKSESIDCVVTSPPYWNMRDFGVDGQIGLEVTPEEYAEKLVSIFRECKQVLKKEGTLWLNLGDTYSSGGHGGGGSFMNLRGDGAWSRRKNKRGFRGPPEGYKPKDLVGVPWMVAFALREHGWYLRQDIIWSKLSPMPESVKDRCTKAHEYIFLLSKSKDYYFDHDAIAEPCAESNEARPRMGQGPNTKYNQKRRNLKLPDGRDPASGNQAQLPKDQSKANKRSVWTIPPAPYPKAHFATFPPKLIEPCILAGCPEGGIVLDPFLGSGTTAAVAKKWGRRCIGIELNEEYCELAVGRFSQRTLF